MRLDLIKEAPSPWRRLFALGCIGAFLFTIALAEVPQLHERIHQGSATASHECAVTLLKSGNCTQTPCHVVAIAPVPARATSAISRDLFQLLLPRLEFSLLEHAPPAFS
jgi:hypothetical protein